MEREGRRPRHHQQPDDRLEPGNDPHERGGTDVAVAERCIADDGEVDVVPDRSREGALKAAQNWVVKENVGKQLGLK